MLQVVQRATHPHSRVQRYKIPKRRFFPAFGSKVEVLMAWTVMARMNMPEAIHLDQGACERVGWMAAMTLHAPNAIAVQVFPWRFISVMVLAKSRSSKAKRAPPHFIACPTNIQRAACASILSVLHPTGSQARPEAKPVLATTWLKTTPNVRGVSAAFRNVSFLGFCHAHIQRVDSLSNPARNAQIPTNVNSPSARGRISGEPQGSKGRPSNMGRMSCISRYGGPTATRHLSTPRRPSVLSHSIATTAQHPQRRVCFIVDKPRIFDLKLPNRWSIDRPRWQSECP